jgi:alpha-beta hydrolase superfamily lysophospholipase
VDDYTEPIVAHLEAIRNTELGFGTRNSEVGVGARNSVSFEGIPVFLLGHSMGGLVALFASFVNAHLFKVKNWPYLTYLYLT